MDSMDSKRHCSICKSDFNTSQSHFQPCKCRTPEMTKSEFKQCGECDFSTKSFTSLAQHYRIFHKPPEADAMNSQKEKNSIGNEEPTSPHSTTEEPTSHHSTKEEPTSNHSTTEEPTSHHSTTVEPTSHQCTSEANFECLDCHEVGTKTAMKKHQLLCFKCEFCLLWKKDRRQHNRHCNLETFESKQNKKAEKCLSSDRKKNINVC